MTYSWENQNPATVLPDRCLSHKPPPIMEPLTPQVMHKLVFTILVHGLPDAQTNVAYEVLLEAQNNPHPQVRELALVALAELPVPAAKRVAALSRALRDPAPRLRRLGPAATPGTPGLVALRTESETRSRVVAATALKRVGRGAIPALLAGLRQGDPELRVRCATILKHVAPDDANIAEAIRAAEADDERYRTSEHTIPFAIAVA